MRSWDEMEEIEALGEEEGGAWGPEDSPSPPPQGGGLSTVPLLQAAVCALALLGLLYLRQTGHPAYKQIAERYRQEAAQEWRLPQWEAGASPSPSPSPSPSQPPSEAPAGALGPQPQRL